MTPALRQLINAARFRVRSVAVASYVAAALVLVVTLLIGPGGDDLGGPLALIAMILMIAGAFHAWYLRLGWDRNPVLRALRDEPGTIVAALFEDALQSLIRLDEGQVLIYTDETYVRLTFKRNEIGPLGRALLEVCPAIELRGFEHFNTN